jgi:hypothetical protein
MTIVRPVHCLALLLLGCAKEPPPQVAAPPPAAPLSVAELTGADAGPALAAPFRAVSPAAQADAGPGARMLAPGAQAGGSSGFRATPTDDGDAGPPLVGPRRPYGPVPTMDSHRQVKPPPFNKHTAPPPGPVFPRGPASAVDAGSTGPLTQ